MNNSVTNQQYQLPSDCFQQQHETNQYSEQFTSFNDVLDRRTKQNSKQKNLAIQPQIEMQMMLQTIRQTLKDMQESVIQDNNRSQLEERILKRLELKFQNFNLSAQQLSKLIKIEQNLINQRKNRKSNSLLDEDQSKSRKKNLVEVQMHSMKKNHPSNHRNVKITWDQKV